MILEVDSDQTIGVNIGLKTILKLITNSFIIHLNYLNINFISILLTSDHFMTYLSNDLLNRYNSSFCTNEGTGFQEQFLDFVNFLYQILPYRFLNLPYYILLV